MVSGMRHIKEWFNFNGLSAKAKVGGSNTYLRGGTYLGPGIEGYSKFKVPFCYYFPISYGKTEYDMILSTKNILELSYSSYRY